MPKVLIVVSDASEVRLSPLRALAVVLSLSAVTLPARADEITESETLQKRVPAAARDQTPQEQPSISPATKAESSAKRTLDDELLERLGGKAPAANDDSQPSIDAVVRAMRDAQKRLADSDAGRETQTIQADIVKQLEKLIEQAGKSKSNPNPPPMPPSPNQQPQQPEQRRQAEQDRQQRDRRPSKTSQQEQQQTERSRRENERAKESTDETRAARQREAELARQAEMVNEVWGHLPPAIREKLLNIRSEKYLPKYEDDVRRYFESLATPRDQNR